MANNDDERKIDEVASGGEGFEETRRSIYDIDGTVAVSWFRRYGGIYYIRFIQSLIFYWNGAMSFLTAGLCRSTMVYTVLSGHDMDRILWLIGHYLS